MLDNEPTGADGASNDQPDINPATGRPRRRAASRPAGPPPPATETASSAGTGSDSGAGAAKAPARRSRAKKAAPAEPASPEAAADTADTATETEAPAKKTAAKRTRKPAAAAETTEVAEVAAAATPADDAEPTTGGRRRKRAATAPAADAAPADGDTDAAEPAVSARTARRRKAAATEADVEAKEAADDEATAEDEDEEATVEVAAGIVPVMFQPPTAVFQEPTAPRRRRRSKAAELDEDEAAAEEATEDAVDVEVDADAETDADATEGEKSEDEGAEGAPRRRRRRGGRGRRGRGRSESGEGTDGESDDTESTTEAAEDGADGDEGEQSEGGSSRRRRRRRRGGSSEDAPSSDDPPNTVVRVREPRSRRSRGGDDEVTALRGSTRIEAKKQRRREGREAGRRRPPVLTEAEFLARRESVERIMVIRQTPVRTQIAVIEDGVLVEHHVSHDNAETSGSMIGNVYLGRVQNVLPSMEAAFVDIGRGRNAVLYAGEVNWDAVGLEGQPKRIEHALKSGDPVLVQVTKDPVGQKGARLTSQISLPGRYLVYVPEGSMNGISRKLPENERARLKSILKKVVPEQAGVIVRTAAEGASEEELSRDVERLSAQWNEIETKAKSGSTNAPSLLHGEPDLTTRVVRDVFNEDFAKLVVSGEDAWTTVDEYIGYVAPDLRERLEKWSDSKDVFDAYRVDEQLLKALDRKVYLPSGGSLVIDRTEAMTVVDVNTGKFTGQGGNLEETVTRNNLEAAEEIVRQLRLRDVGGIIVVDFIDMVLESNRDLVLRRLLECLGRDRTKHQVAEVTSLGLVQMTRKRVGAGLLEVFSETCDCCNGRGLKISLDAPKAGKGSKADKKDAAEKIGKIVGASKPKKDGEAADASAEADGEGGDEKPKAKKASRSRKKKAAEPEATAEGTSEAPAEAAADGAADAPAEGGAEGAVDGVEAAEPTAEQAPKPRTRRSRAKKAAAAPEPAAEPAAEGSEGAV